MSELNEKQILESRIEMLKARVSELEKENKHHLDIISERDKQLKKIESNLKDLIRVQKESVASDSYNAGLYNGFVTSLYTIKDKEVPGIMLCRWTGSIWEIPK